MTQQQAQTELQEIERIADAILRGDKYYDGRENLRYDKSKIFALDIELPRGQRCGTHYQQKSYALIKARELFNNATNK